MQDCINIYNGGALSAAVGQVIDAMWSDRITGELTLSFTTTVERVPEITPETSIEFRGQYFRAVQVRAETADGAFLLSVSCEQETVTLVDDEVTLFDFEGTPEAALEKLLSGTGITGHSEYTDVIRLKEENTNRRAVLMVIVGICGGELEYDGHSVRIVKHRGRMDVRALTELLRFSEMSCSADLQAGTESYEVIGWKPEDIAVGDEVSVDFGPLGIHTQWRIVGISYNPFNCTSVRVEAGDFVPDILESYRDVIEESADAAEKAEDAKDKIDEIGADLADVVKKSELSADIDTYINSETGRASIVASLSGTYITEDKLSGYVEKTELSAEIGAYIDTEAGTAKIVNKLTGTFVKEDSLGNYVEKTELSTEIGSYIDTAAGTAKIVAAAEGTYQKKSDMSGYVTTTTLNTSIAQYIDSSTGQAKIVSACSGTYVTESDLSGYAKTSALASIEQSVSDVETAITMSSSYSKNTIGTNVYALLQLVTNANSSSIKVQADKIDFTGFTTFVKASDLGASGSTSIDGGRITTGTISADRIDTSSITLSDVYGKGTYADYLMITSSGHYMYIGSDITTTKGVYESIDIRSDTLGFGNTSTRGLVIDHANKVFRPNSSSATGGYNLGTATYQWNNLYVNKIYINGTKLDTDSSGSTVDRIYAGSSTTYYVQLNSSKALVGSGTGYSLGTTSYPYQTLYVGTGSSYYWKFEAAAILPSGTSTSYFNIGSSTYPVNKLYARQIYLNGSEITGGGTNMAGSLVKMGGSSSYYIQATTSRQLCPSSSSTTYPCYLGTSSLYWHYAYIGSNTASIGSSASSKIGFFGTTPVARKTVSSTADVATLITALKAYGLIA